MAQKKAAPYGSWPSPITADLVLSSAITLSEPTSLSPSSSSQPQQLVWIESRPSEQGRNALVSKWIGGDAAAAEKEVIKDVKWNARTRVHEYGGGSVALLGEQGKVVFSSIEGPLYVVEQGQDEEWSEPKQVSPESSILRYADFSSHPQKSSIVITVQEDHTIDLPSKVVNTIALLNTETTTLYSVVSGADFYSAPRWSPSGKYLCWIQWNHPDMPWDGSELWVAPVSLSSSSTTSPLALDLSKALKIAGQGDGVESVSQPRWSLEEGKEELVFLSDRSGFYELYKWSEGSAVKKVLAEGVGEGKDVGAPDWQFAASTHAPLSPTTWISKAPSGDLLLTTLSTSSSTLLSTRYASISSLRPLSSTQIAIVADLHESPSILSILTLSSDLKSIEHEEIIKVSSSAKVDEDYISVGEKIEFPTKTPEGSLEDKRVAYGIFYPPRNKRYSPIADTLPPLIVHCHGGPTSSAQTGLTWAVQWFTSRGFAYVDVDYGGSSGYGREFRKRLETQWGVVDVLDTISAVEYLVDQGKVDKGKVAIDGGSAGGFTVLNSLVAGDVFTAGTSLYGISDLVLLAGDTHKFESQYLYRLLGGTLEEVPQHYHDRSPINFSTKITAPLLLLQGSIDKVVPPEQATRMAEMIRGAGGRADMIIFEGEGHGFRRADSKKKAFEAELEFYREVWGIEEVAESHI